MKRTAVDPKLKLKRRTITQLDPKQLETVTGGHGGDKTTYSCDSSSTRLCHGF